MYWALGVAVVAVVGLCGYVLWLRFMDRVYREHGIDGLTKVAEVMPPPRWTESLASVLEKLAKARTSMRSIDEGKPKPGDRHWPD
jgi:hypothetical protein